MKNYEIILFDLDGTLTDPKVGIVNSIKYALHKMKKPGLIELDLLKFIGPPIQHSFANICHMNEEEVQQAVHYYREYFSKNGMMENKLYDGIRELLNALHKEGKKLLVATSKPTVFAVQIVNYFQLENYFIEVVGSELDGTRIDKKDIIEYIFQKYAFFPKQNAVMIGDRSHDIIGAKKMNVHSIGVEYGYGSKEELVNAGADYIAKSVSHLNMLLQDNKVNR
ncbi:HAD family hydrolase [Bacillus sp. EAC]|uniref:HAD family hydrolase n=1 Tax=Bacillus sp. EAC TaxID=1978338 RepID=UPI000B454038|nr:HAD family hydrolase [Bacillus sp. EAC]